MLCDAEFSPALDAIDQIILFLLALINSIVNLLFGKTDGKRFGAAPCGRTKT